MPTTNIDPNGVLLSEPLADGAPSRSQATIQLTELEWMILREAVSLYDAPTIAAGEVAEMLYHRLRKSNEFHHITLTRNRDN